MFDVKIEGFTGEYRYLSNFYSAEVEYEGIKYLNSESAYQASKSKDKEIRLHFMQVSGSTAKKLGKRVKLRPDWDKVKYDIMYDIVLDKFTRNEGLKDKLLATGYTELVETNTWGDTYWGVCRGRGKNNLGKILMDVRGKLKNKNT